MCGNPWIKRAVIIVLVLVVTVAEHLCHVCITSIKTLSVWTSQVLKILLNAPPFVLFSSYNSERHKQQYGFTQTGADGNITSESYVILCVCLRQEERIPSKLNEAVDHHSVSGSINPQAGPMFSGSDSVLISRTHWSRTARASPPVQYRARILFIFCQIKVCAEHEILSLFSLLKV